MRSLIPSAGEAQSQALVWFGCTGDLGFKMTFPALFRMEQRGTLTVPIVGVAWSGWDLDEVRARARQSIEDNGGGIQSAEDAAAFDRLVSRLDYVDGDYSDPKTLSEVARRLRNAGVSRPTHYLAIPPALFATVIGALSRNGLADRGRIIVEKPFGRDLDSALALNDIIHTAFDEEDIFRIDHYLGKEEVLGILYTRFANSVFEPLWDRRSIESVQITMAEDFGVEGRGLFYDEVGALRDVVQNHLLQLVTLLAMEPPTSMDPTEVRAEADKVLAAIAPISPHDIVRGQYNGYRDEPGVAAGSDAETFVAIRLEIDNWRWSGVPWLIRAGKQLPVHATEARLRFRKPPAHLFVHDEYTQKEADYIRIRVTPDGEMALGLHTKSPGPEYVGDVRELALRSEAGGLSAYERLLGDALVGDRSLFTSSTGVERAWSIVDHVLRDHPAAEPYEPGSWGPTAAADRLAGRAGPWFSPSDAGPIPG